MTFALARKEPSHEMSVAGYYAVTKFAPLEVHGFDAAEQTFAAMLSASEPPTDAEIDSLCLAMWPDGWQWKREYDMRWDEHAELVRGLDRARVKKFLTLITVQS